MPKKAPKSHNIKSTTLFSRCSNCGKRKSVKDLLPFGVGNYCKKHCFSQSMLKRWAKKLKINLRENGK